MIGIDDPNLPGLAALDQDGLRRITGAEAVSLTRLRYRAGNRAILQLETADAFGNGQGALWFFRGDKARKLAQHDPGARYDPQMAAVYQAFPSDHRMPQIRAFLQHYDSIAPGLLGTRPRGAPRLLRYRPGLSCTFACEVAGGGTVFVKLIGDDDPTRLSLANARIAGLLAAGPLSIAPVIGHDPGLGALAYAAAAGIPLDLALSRKRGLGPILQTTDALRRLWALPVTPARHLDRTALLQTAATSAAMIALTLPRHAAAAEATLGRLRAQTPRLASRPIHADLKLEHIFLGAGRTTLIDTESVSLGPPDYDLAMLACRLRLAGIEGTLPVPVATAAAARVRDAAGDSFAWCHDLATLRLARSYAQRPFGAAQARVAAIFGPLA